MTGKERWRVEERSSHTASTRPVAGHGMVFYPTGWEKPQLLADASLTARGDVTATHVVWRYSRGIPNKPSILLVEDLIFMVSDAGDRVRTRSQDRHAGLAAARSAARSPLRRCPPTGADLPVRRRRQDDGDRSRPRIQSPGGESARQRLHGFGGGRGKRAVPADDERRLSNRGGAVNV